MGHPRHSALQGLRARWQTVMASARIFSNCLPHAVLRVHALMWCPANTKPASCRMCLAAGFCAWSILMVVVTAAWLVRQYGHYTNILLAKHPSGSHLLQLHAACSSGLCWLQVSARAHQIRCFAKYGTIIHLFAFGGASPSKCLKALVNTTAAMACCELLPSPWPPGACARHRNTGLILRSSENGFRQRRWLSLM